MCPTLQFDDEGIQVIKDGNFGTYLDIKPSLAKQADEFEEINNR